ncbi:hypothetical protein EVAR_85455_1 [Eumeta japonica]|uniref:Uncharacterized protein n=1 Tax=Eumeta variegata TaxID=151549 RepID=A0A4C1WL66_EUMVA|nr:hypothetical protein EVAR_85455_1 [Eumeta japonica]
MSAYRGGRNVAAVTSAAAVVLSPRRVAGLRTGYVSRLNRNSCYAATVTSVGKTDPYFSEFFSCGTLRNKASVYCKLFDFDFRKDPPSGGRVLIKWAVHFARSTPKCTHSIRAAVTCAVPEAAITAAVGAGAGLRPAGVTAPGAFGNRLATRRGAHN